MAVTLPQMLTQMSKPTIDSTQITGEPGTGFETAGSKGPFECGNCAHMKKGACMQKTMNRYSKQPRNADGNPKVGPHDCCEYVERIGK